MQGKAKDNTKKKAKSVSDDSDEDSDNSDDNIRRTLQTKKKVMDALFHMKWWRIVLGEDCCCADLHEV